MRLTESILIVIFKTDRLVRKDIEEKDLRNKEFWAQKAKAAAETRAAKAPTSMLMAFLAVMM